MGEWDPDILDLIVIDLRVVVKCRVVLVRIDFLFFFNCFRGRFCWDCLISAPLVIGMGGNIRICEDF